MITFIIKQIVLNVDIKPSLYQHHSQVFINTIAMKSNDIILEYQFHYL